MASLGTVRELTSADDPVPATMSQEQYQRTIFHPDCDSPTLQVQALPTFAGRMTASEIGRLRYCRTKRYRGMAHSVPPSHHPQRVGLATIRSIPAQTRPITTSIRLPRRTFVHRFNTIHRERGTSLPMG